MRNDGGVPPAPGGHDPYQWRSSVALARGWYLSLALASLLLSLSTATTGAGYAVVFGGIALYFLVRAVRIRSPPAIPPGMAETDLSDRGGMPLAVIAVAGMLLATSGASFVLDVSAVNPPGDGVCDNDRSPATVTVPASSSGGTGETVREFCDGHAAFFLVLSPLAAHGMAGRDDIGAAPPDGPLALVALASAGLWAAFAGSMLLASVDAWHRRARWDPLFVVCGLRCGGVSLATAIVATLLFVLASAVWAADLGVPPNGWPLYLAAMAVFIVFLATFFRRRGTADSR